MIELSAEALARAVARPAAFALPSTALDPALHARAAVVVPVSLGPSPEVIVVVRSAELAEYPGELAFPGGKPLSDSESLRDAAYRELHEELAVRPTEVEDLGSLISLPVARSQYWITPFVGLLGPAAKPRIACSEIERLVRVPLLPWLSGQMRFAVTQESWRGEAFVLPHFRLGPDVLYGASACIFYDLLARLSGTLGAPLPEPVLTEERPWGKRYGAT